MIDAFVEQLQNAGPANDELIVFTAHSLPVRVINEGDRYAEEVTGTARAVVSQGRHAQGDLRIDPTVEITPGRVQRALGGAS